MIFTVQRKCDTLKRHPLTLRYTERVDCILFVIKINVLPFSPETTSGTLCCHLNSRHFPCVISGCWTPVPLWGMRTPIAIAKLNRLNAVTLKNRVIIPHLFNAGSATQPRGLKTFGRHYATRGTRRCVG